MAGESGYGNANEAKRKLFESLMPKFDLSDEDMTVETSRG